MFVVVVEGRKEEGRWNSILYFPVCVFTQSKRGKFTQIKIHLDQKGDVDFCGRGLGEVRLLSAEGGSWDRRGIGGFSFTWDTGMTLRDNGHCL